MNKSKISEDQLKEAVKISFSFRQLLRNLGLRQAGGTQSHYKRRLQSLKIDFSHFTGQAHNRGKYSNKRRSARSILIKRDEGSRTRSTLLVRALSEVGVPHECSKCSLGSSWMGEKLTLDVDHINEDWLDDRLENLRFLCPNCHSQFSRKLL